MVRDDGERTRTAAGKENFRTIPRLFQANPASLEAGWSWRRRDRQLGFAVVQSPCRGVVGGAGSTVAVRERGLSWVRREKPIAWREKALVFFLFYYRISFFFLKPYIFNKTIYTKYIFENSTTRDYRFRIVFN